jgi:hypothetical protein
MWPVIFEFTSLQFVFLSGRLVLFRLVTGEKPAFVTMDGRVYDVLDPESIEQVRMQQWDLLNGVTRPIPVNAAGPFHASIGKMKLLRKEDQREFSITGTAVQREITEEDLQRGRVIVDSNIPQVITIRVEDAGGGCIPNATVCLITDAEEGSTEVITNEKGEITIPGVVGRYHTSAYVLGSEPRRSEPAQFEVSTTDSGERLVILQIPNPTEP